MWRKSRQGTVSFAMAPLSVTLLCSLFCGLAFSSIALPTANPVYVAMAKYNIDEVDRAVVVEAVALIQKEQVYDASQPIFANELAEKLLDMGWQIVNRYKRDHITGALSSLVQHGRVDGADMLLRNWDYVRRWERTGYQTRLIELLTRWCMGEREMRSPSFTILISRSNDIKLCGLARALLSVQGVYKSYVVLAAMLSPKPGFESLYASFLNQMDHAEMLFLATIPWLNGRARSVLSVRLGLLQSQYQLTQTEKNILKKTTKEDTDPMGFVVYALDLYGNYRLVDNDLCDVVDKICHLFKCHSNGLGAKIVMQRAAELGSMRLFELARRHYTIKSGILLDTLDWSLGIAVWKATSFVMELDTRGALAKKPLNSVLFRFTKKPHFAFQIPELIENLTVDIVQHEIPIVGFLIARHLLNTVSLPPELYVTSASPFWMSFIASVPGAQSLWRMVKRDGDRFFQPRKLSRLLNNFISRRMAEDKIDISIQGLNLSDCVSDEFAIVFLACHLIMHDENVKTLPFGVVLAVVVHRLVNDDLSLQFVKQLLCRHPSTKEIAQLLCAAALTRNAQFITDLIEISRRHDVILEAANEFAKTYASVPYTLDGPTRQNVSDLMEIACRYADERTERLIQESERRHSFVQRRTNHIFHGRYGYRTHFPY